MFLFDLLMERLSKVVVVQDIGMMWFRVNDGVFVFFYYFESVLLNFIVVYFCCLKELIKLIICE